LFKYRRKDKTTFINIITYYVCLGFSSMLVNNWAVIAGLLISHNITYLIIIPNSLRDSFLWFNSCFIQHTPIKYLQINLNSPKFCTSKTIKTSETNNIPFASRPKYTNIKLSLYSNTNSKTYKNLPLQILLCNIVFSGC
jgi:hypothetical protein